MGIEDPDADVVEQLHPVDDPDGDGGDDGGDDAGGALPPEADPADVADQRRAVPQDADER
jgi:hypothetical protein